MEKINKIKTQFFEDSNKMDKFSETNQGENKRKHKKQTKKTQSTRIRNERRDITTELTDKNGDYKGTL